MKNPKQKAHKYISDEFNEVFHYWFSNNFTAFDKRILKLNKNDTIAFLAQVSDVYPKHLPKIILSIWYSIETK